MKKYFLVVAIICLSEWTNAQIITTVVGNGTFGYSGDSGLATAAQISHVNTVSFDTGNVIYFPDVDNHVIRKVNAAGIITTVAGTGTGGYNGDGIAASTAQLYYPYDIVFDRYNNMYIADGANFRVRKISPAGIITTFAGSGTSGSSGDGGPATSAQIGAPYSLAMDTAGNLYIACGGNTIRKVTPAGIISTIAGTGVSGFSGDGGLATSAQLNVATGIAVDKKGNIYVGDNGRVRKIAPSGIITTIAGNGSTTYSGDGGAATAAGMATIRLNVDNNGNVFVCDNINNRLRKIDAAGIVTTYAGTGVGGYNGDTLLATNAELNYPQGVRFDRNAIMYITEWGNQRIRKVTICSDIVVPPANYIVTAGSSAHFTIVDTGSANYQWQEDAGAGYVSLVNAGVYSGVTTKTLSISNAITSMNNYNYRCIVSYGGICIDTTTSATLMVWKLGLQNINNSIGVKIYPIPAKNILYVESLKRLGSVQLINTFGQIVVDVQINASKAQLDISRLSAGIYFLKADNTFVQKLVKE